MTLLHKGIDGGTGKYGSFKSGTWSSLLEFCYHTIDIVEAVQEVLGGEQLPLCARVTETLNKFDLQRIGRMVHEVVDLESSVEQHRTVVKRGVDENLDQIKDVYDGMDDLLSHTAVEIARTMPAEINCSLNVIYFPQLGFHITVPIDETTGEVVWSDPDWERMFTTKIQVYFKDVQMRKMDQDLGDLWANICDIEIELAYELAQRVLQDEKLLVAASDLCGELDSLLGLVHGALEHKLTRPKLVDENTIDIKGGRHILQEMTVPSYVPNDTVLAGGDIPVKEGKQPGNMLMLTGPNYSGKSVYLKQVALIIYLAQIGSFVPADSCIVGVTDKILTRITTTETVSKAHSAFMIDMQQISIALNSCTSRSLVVIDEFGKGTDSCDGAGLAAGVFYHLLNLGPNSPKVLAATHFHEIFELGLFDDSHNLKYAHMEVRVDKRERERIRDHSSEVTYLYNLRPGRSNLSYGAQCAAMNGIPDQIVNRAIELADLMTKGEDLVTVCSAMKEEDVEELLEAEAAARTFLGQEFENLKGEEGEGEGSELNDDLEEFLSSILHADSARKSTECRRDPGGE